MKIDVVPPERMKTMYDMMRDIEGREQGPCGGFTVMYACMCDYYNLTFRDEVAWVSDYICCICVCVCVCVCVLKELGPCGKFTMMYASV